MSNAPQKPQAFSHMLWFFIVPCVGFLGWAGYQWVSALTQKPKASTPITQKIEKIKAARNPGDRWQTAYALSQDLQKIIRNGEWSQTNELERQTLVQNLSDLLVEFKNDPRLGKYLLLTLGQLKDVSSLDGIESFFDSQDPEMKFFSAWAYIEILQDKKEAATPERISHVESWLKSPDPAFRKIAASFLVQQSDPRLKEKILPLLEDPNIEVRWNAAVALSTVGDSRGFEVLKTAFDLGNLRALNFRSSKDLSQVLGAAWQAALKSKNSELLIAAQSLRQKVNPATPEGKAILNAIPEVATR